MKKVIIYTDGASRGNPGKGGWGAVLIYGKHQKIFYGYEPVATNNQMELTAAIKALEKLSEKCEVILITDSKYIAHGVTEWLPNWKKNHWRTSTNKPVKNKELWQTLDQLVQKHIVQWRWVKGHSGDSGNELADSLANRAIDEEKNNAANHC